MQNDYEMLYELIKERTEQCERLWKSILVQLKETSPPPSTSKASNEFNSLNEAPNRGSFGRRINPTLLKSELAEISSPLNPFVSAPTEGNECILNRPVAKPAWKKLAPPSTIVKVVSGGSEIDSDESAAVKMELAVYFKQGVTAEKKDLLKQAASAFYQILFDEIVVNFASFTEGFGMILKNLSVGHELFCLKSFFDIVKDRFLMHSFSNSSNAFIDNPVDLMLFSVYFVHGARDRLVQILPDSVKSFEKNSLIELIDPSLEQFFKSCLRSDESTLKLSTSLSEGGTGLSLHSLIPVAYSNQRDSKNFFRDPLAHSNQQKIRDLFINLIRHFSTNQLDTSSPNFHRSFSSRISELMGKLNRDNYGWLADLYIQEYEQAADIRLDRLEDRMAAPRRSQNATNVSTTFSLDQIFFLFLQYADSFKLTKAVEKKVIAMISASLEQANNPHKRHLWSECIRNLRSAMKLLGVCRYKLLSVDDEICVEEEDILMYSWTQEAILNRQLLTFLPLINEYFSFIGADAIKARCSNTVKLLIRYYQVKFEMKRKRSPSKLLKTTAIRSKMLLRLGLEDTFRETLPTEFYSECIISMEPVDGGGGATEVMDESIVNDEASSGDEKRISTNSRSKEGEVLARPIDDDDNLPPGVSLVYRSISSQIRGIYAQLNSICTRVGLNSILNGGDKSTSTTTTTPSHSSFSSFASSSDPYGTDSTPRKVRPITQVPASDLKQQRIQKQLRQWFWWRYGSQKDLVDALNAYILEQLLFPLFPMNHQDRSHSFETCKLMYQELIGKVLPELLPNFWREQPELVEMIIHLSFELANKAIKHHFS